MIKTSCSYSHSLIDDVPISKERGRYDYLDLAVNHKQLFASIQYLSSNQIKEFSLVSKHFDVLKTKDVSSTDVLVKISRIVLFTTSTYFWSHMFPYHYPSNLLWAFGAYGLSGGNLADDGDSLVEQFSLKIKGGK